MIEATAALGAYTRRGERRDAFDGMSVYTLQDGHGVLSYAENISPLASKLSFHVKLDHTGSRNARPSRGELKSTDVVTPMHGQLLQVLNVAHRGGGGYEMRCAMQYARQQRTAETHHPDAQDCYMHASVSLAS